MTLSKDDMEFLGQVGRQLGPRLSSLSDALELAQTPEVAYLYNSLKEEASDFSYSLLLWACPKLYSIIENDIELIDEFRRQRDTIVLYALTRGYEAGKQYAQS